MKTPDRKPQSLGALPVGASALVRHVGCARPVARRLMEMGLLPGTRVTVTRIAPLGDPIELRLRDYSLSIRHAEAASVEVHDVEVSARDSVPAAAHEVIRISSVPPAKRTESEL